MEGCRSCTEHSREIVDEEVELEALKLLDFCEEEDDECSLCSITNCSKGSPNAAVFPDPVSAEPMTSTPPNKRGMLSS